MLGLLGMILLLAVAFATTMRTERLAARNYSDAVQARNLVQLGLARVIDEVDQQMVAGNLLYPPQAMFYYSTTSAAGQATSDFLESGAEDWKWLPNKVRLDGKMGAGFVESIAGSDVDWLPVMDPDNTGVQIGRYAFMVFDTSGMLDINSVATTNRASGIYPGEIQIGTSLLSDIVPGSFQSSRNAYVRYETMPELYAADVTRANGAFNFFPFSYFPTNRLDRFGRPEDASDFSLLDIGTNGYASLTQLELENAFKACGVTDPIQATYLYVAFRDFTDSDSDPSSPVKGPCVEDVPMLNQVVLGTAQKIDASGTNTTLAIDQAYFEFRRPDVDPGPSATYELTYRISAQRLPQDASPVPLQTFTVQFTSSGDYQVVPGTASTLTVPNGGVPQAWQVTVDQILVKRVSDSVNVDGVQGEMVCKVAPTAMAATYFDYECLDPRFNWDPSPTGAKHWQLQALVGSRNSTSLGRINEWTRSYLANPAADADGIGLSDADERTRIYVKNAPFETVAELGYLPYAPWKSIRLYDYKEFGVSFADGPHRVYEHFYVDRPLKSKRGYVNLLTDEPQVLACVWLDMPVDDYIGDNSPQYNVGDTGAGAVALEAVKARKLNAPTSTLSDMADALGKAFSMNQAPAASEFQREAYFRNAEHLFRLRQNIFTILVLAEAGAEDPNGDFVPMAQAKAVAVVWRDPALPQSGDPFNRPDSEGVFVRSFKWLDD